jgi:hypothetical protein
MQFVAKAVSLEEFNAWVQQSKEMQSPLSSGAYAALVEPSSNDPVHIFSTIDRSLYTRVIMSYMDPQSERVATTSQSVAATALKDAVSSPSTSTQRHAHNEHTMPMQMMYTPTP